MLVSAIEVIESGRTCPHCKKPKSLARLFQGAEEFRIDDPRNTKDPTPRVVVWVCIECGRTTLGVVKR